MIRGSLHVSRFIEDEENESVVAEKSAEAREQTDRGEGQGCRVEDMAERDKARVEHKQVHLLNDPGPSDQFVNGASFVMQSNLKILAKAVQALSRLAEDLYLEPSEEGLVVKTFNRSRSAYGKFSFQRDFFTSSDTSKLDPNTKNQCRVSMKTMTAIFRQIHFNGETAFQEAKLLLDPNADTFLVEIKLAYDGVRTIEPRLLENTSGFRATVDRNTLKNVCVLTGTLLHSVMKEMRENSEDIVLSASNDGFCFSNYGRCIAERKTRMSVTLVEERFEQFNIQRKTDLAISYREFMAIVEFASKHMAFVSLYFDLPGRPLVIALEDVASFTAEFILATIEPDEEEHEERRAGSQQANQEHSQQSQRHELLQQTNAIRVASKRTSHVEQHQDTIIVRTDEAPPGNEGDGQVPDYGEQSQGMEMGGGEQKEEGNASKSNHRIKQSLLRAALDETRQPSIIDDTPEKGERMDVDEGLAYGEEVERMEMVATSSNIGKKWIKGGPMTDDDVPPVDFWAQMDAAVLDNNYATPSIGPIGRTQSVNPRSQSRPITLAAVPEPMKPPSITSIAVAQPSSIATNTGIPPTTVSTPDVDNERIQMRRFRRNFLGYRQPVESASQLYKDLTPVAQQSDEEDE